MRLPCELAGWPLQGCFYRKVDQSMNISIKWQLVGGLNPTPLKNDGVRQLGWWHDPKSYGKIKFMATKPPNMLSMGLRPPASRLSFVCRLSKNWSQVFSTQHMSALSTLVTNLPYWTSGHRTKIQEARVESGKANRIIVWLQMHGCDFAYKVVPQFVNAKLVNISPITMVYRWYIHS